MRILIVEDDFLQAEWISEKLREEIPYANVDLISTESEFYSRFDEIINTRPDVVVMDVMLRWTDPRPNLTNPPVHILREGSYRAGLRCVSMLAEDTRTSQIPVILYTVLERTDLSDRLPDLPKNVWYLSKQSDIDALQQRIREIVISPQDAF